jgi:filamentous hemagglutinin family protein
MSLNITRSISIVCTWGSIVVFPQIAVAQIIPDSTQPTNSIVTVEETLQRISGGTQVGGNLFHSFDRFNIRTGETALFDNASTIDNIITRVTGGQISHIDGLIRANGTANLFLINPRGILFGANARLEIGGSFLGSTANSIQFKDGSIFSAAHPDTSPLLTMSVPVGLQLGQNSGTLSVSGTGHSLTFDSDPYASPLQRSLDAQGLQVKPGHTLALVGSQVALDGGILTAESGSIELGGVIQGQVTLNPATIGWTLSYPQVQNYGDIRLSAAALLDARGGGGSGIHIAGRQVMLGDGSLALTDPLLGSLPGGEIVLTASEFVSLSGLNPIGIPSSLRSQAVAGKGGAITVSTPHLILSNGGYIDSVVFGTGFGGDITIDVFDDLQVIGASPFSQGSLSGIESANYGAKNGGDITLSTSRLQLIDGGSLVATTYGAGRGGNVQVRATDSIELTGFNRVSPTQVRFRSAILAETIGSGEAGNLTLDTAKLSVRDGARIGAGTVASGAGGNLTVYASESIEVSGVGTGTSLQSLLSSSALANTPIQRFLGLPLVPSGDAGTATINTPRLIVSNSGRVGVENQGIGRGGDLMITAQQIVVEEGGRITAATASGEGGNLVLNASSLEVNRLGQVNAEAGGTGNGGNITLNTDTIAVLQESRITANAVRGQGGAIKINTIGLFTAPDSTITASSQFGVSGTVAINNPEVNTSAGLVELADTPIDPSERVIVGCAARSGSSFTITGRGGLPEDPTRTIRGQTVLSDFRDFSTSATNEALTTTQNRSAASPGHSSLVEATGWRVNARGEVELVASESPQRTNLRAIDCREW